MVDKANLGFYLVDDTLEDTVSCLRWSPQANFLAASAWDGKVRIWEIKESYYNALAAQPFLATSMGDPILQISWSHEGNVIFAGSTDKTIKMWDLSQNKVTNIGQFTQAVAQVQWCDSLNVLFTMSWDKTVAIWDVRQPTPAMRVVLDHKPHYMSISSPMLAVAMTNKKIAAFDLNRVIQGYFQPIICVDGLLQRNTSALAAFTNGWVLGSIEGRCEVRTIQNVPSDFSNQEKNYTFKCHRNVTIHPVNAITVNPQYGTFVTAGGDGKFHSWDKDAKLKLKNYPDSKMISKNKTYLSTTLVPVVGCSYNHNGMLLAVAFGYDWAKGVNDYEILKNEIYVHKCSLDEIEPKKSYPTSLSH